MGASAAQAAGVTPAPFGPTTGPANLAHASAVSARPKRGVDGVAIMLEEHGIKLR